jgi:hypothetical protein
VVAQQFALGGQPHRARRALDQPRPEGRFEPLQRGAGGCRRQLQLARSGAERPGFGDAHEKFELRKRQVARIHGGSIFKNHLNMY